MASAVTVNLKFRGARTTQCVFKAVATTSEKMIRFKVKFRYAKQHVAKGSSRRRLTMHITNQEVKVSYLMHTVSTLVSRFANHSMSIILSCFNREG